LPIVDQLRRNFGIEELDGEPEIIAKVEHGMRRMGGLDAHIPYVRYLLSVDPGDPALAVMDALTRRKKVLDAVRAMSARGAQLRPIVFVFEDLHWVDSSTEEYLVSLMDSVANAPIMLVITHRVGYTPPFGSRSFATTLMLRTLSEADTLAMAGRVLGTEDFPTELRAALMQKAEGVPPPASWRSTSGAAGCGSCSRATQRPSPRPRRWSRPLAQPATGGPRERPWPIWGSPTTRPSQVSTSLT
jgi:hypothetical protein